VREGFEEKRAIRARESNSSKGGRFEWGRDSSEGGIQVREGFKWGRDSSKGERFERGRAIRVKEDDSSKGVIRVKESDSSEGERFE
jgi:hypothetical protein